MIGFNEGILRCFFGFGPIKQYLVSYGINIRLIPIYQVGLQVLLSRQDAVDHRQISIVRHDGPLTQFITFKLHEYFN